MDLFTVENLLTLMMLTLLQAVLGFDNLLYISLESQRVEKSKQAKLRKLGIGLAVVLRLILLFSLMKLIGHFQNPFFAFNWQGVAEGNFNAHSLIVLLGGIFIMYTAMKEIWHMLSLEDTMHEKVKPQSFNKILTMVVVMNMVFSFDSILSAMALTDNYIVMAVAILISSALMIFMADRVAEFLQKNRMYEVLGLFVLFIVGIMLISEGGHMAHLKFFNHPITQMSKTTFYFILTILVIVEIVQSKYSKKLSKLKMEEHQD
ncbi:MAG: tellurium resistance protein TerC [Alcanivoracaceae bacterium]|nr:tellurium resistance protein TerC [Alcanivoracaceae bacterium]